MKDTANVRWRRVRYRLLRWLFSWRGIALIVLLGTLAGISIRTGDSHEDGHSVGTLINVRQEGMIWPRPAATLVHTGEMKGDEFALDPALTVQANAFADQGTRVKVTYVSRYVCWAWNYASCTIITAIEPDPIEAEGLK